MFYIWILTTIYVIYMSKISLTPDVSQVIILDEREFLGFPCDICTKHAVLKNNEYLFCHMCLYYYKNREYNNLPCVICKCNIYPENVCNISCVDCATSISKDKFSQRCDRCLDFFTQASFSSLICSICKRFDLELMDEMSIIDFKNHKNNGIVHLKCFIDEYMDVTVRCSKYKNNMEYISKTFIDLESYNIFKENVYLICRNIDMMNLNRYLHHSFNKRNIKNSITEIEKSIKILNWVKMALLYNAELLNETLKRIKLFRKSKLKRKLLDDIKSDKYTDDTLCLDVNELEFFSFNNIFNMSSSHIIYIKDISDIVIDSLNCFIYIIFNLKHVILDLSLHSIENFLELLYLPKLLFSLTIYMDQENMKFYFHFIQNTKIEIYKLNVFYLCKIDKNKFYKNLIRLLEYTSIKKIYTYISNGYYIIDIQQHFKINVRYNTFKKMYYPDIYSKKDAPCISYIESINHKGKKKITEIHICSQIKGIELYQFFINMDKNINYDKFIIWQYQANFGHSEFRGSNLELSLKPLKIFEKLTIYHLNKNTTFNNNLCIIDVFRLLIKHTKKLILNTSCIHDCLFNKDLSYNETLTVVFIAINAYWSEIFYVIDVLIHLKNIVFDNCYTHNDDIQIRPIRKMESITLNGIIFMDMVIVLKYFSIDTLKIKKVEYFDYSDDETYKLQPKKRVIKIKIYKNECNNPNDERILIDFFNNNIIYDDIEYIE